MDYSNYTREQLIERLKQLELRDAVSAVNTQPGDTESLVLDSLPVAVIRFNKTGRMLATNRFSHIIFAALSDPLAGYSNIEDSPAVKLMQLEEPLHNLIAKDKEFDFETEGLSSGKYVRYMRCIGRVLHPGNESENQYVLIVGDITQRKIIASRYIEHSYNYKALFKVSPNAILLADDNGIIIDVNPALYKSLGYEKDDLIGKNVKILAHPENVTEVERNISQILRGDTLRHTVKSRTKKGDIVYMELHERRVLLANNRYGFISVGRNITERVLAEQALKSARDQLQAVIDAVPGGISWIGRDLRYIGVNRHLWESHKVEANEFIGKKVDEFVPVSEGFIQFAKSFFATDRTKDSCEIQDDFAGRKRTSLIVAQKYSSGNAAVFVDIDITESRHAMEQLEEERNFNRSLVEAAPAIIVILEKPDLIREINKYGLQLSGYRRDQVINKSWMECFASRNDEEDARELLKDMFIEGKMAEGRLASLYTHDGKQRRVLWHNSLLSRGTRQNLVIAVGIDVTENLRLEEQLRQSIKMDAIGKLAGGVAHDFNNLLTIINGYCELLSLDKKLEEESQSKIVQIRDAAERAAGLTSQLLAFSRRQMLKPTIVDLSDLVRNMSKMVSRVLDENIRFETRLAEDLFKIKADPNQIESALLNLIINARDAMPDGGELLIATENLHLDEAAEFNRTLLPAGEYVKLSIRDSGKGIAENIQDKVFEPFFTTKDIGHGTGLGLSMVYGVIKQTGGHIALESEAGKGACFNIFLPRTKEKAPQIKRDGRVHKKPEAHYGILVVEDDDKVRKLVCDILVSNGYVVRNAADGKKGLLAFQAEPEKIKLVLTDVVMPVMNGPEMARHILQIKPSVKILYMSGHPYDVMQGKGLLQSEAEMIKKPFTLDELLLRISGLAEKSDPNEVL